MISSKMRASSLFSSPFIYNIRRSIASSASSVEAVAPVPGKKGGKGKKDKDAGDETTQGEPSRV